MKSNTLMRRLIFTALSQHIESNDLYDAMLIWHSDFATTRDPSLKHFVKTVCSAMGKENKYDSLYWEIIECQKLSKKELLLDPIKEMKHHITKQKEKDFAAHTFALLIVQLGRNIDQIQYLDTNNMKQLLLDSHVGFKAAEAIVRSIKDATPRLIPEKAISSYTKALNTIYVSLCESLGPVKTDKILSLAITEVDKTKYGKSFSAKKFL